MDISVVTNALLGVAATAVAALAGALVAVVPKLWRYLAVQVTGADVLLLRNAMGTQAQISAGRVFGQTATEEAAVEEIIAYARRNLPKALARLKVSDETIHDMARAALARAVLARM